jgi:hypothetical protein
MTPAIKRRYDGCRAINVFILFIDEILIHNLAIHKVIYYYYEMQ